MVRRSGVSYRISDRIRFGIQVTGDSPAQGGWEVGSRPPGVTSGMWIGLGPIWVRLGSRSSWQDEDLDAEMIKPVEP